MENGYGKRNNERKIGWEILKRELAERLDGWRKTLYCIRG